MSTNGIPKVEVVPGTETRETFDGVTALATAETASAAVAAQATAAVQARYLVAMKRPRDWDDVRVKLLGACRRSRFAETARYLKPVGKGVEGWSVRFAEECVRNMTNVLPETATIFDDRSKRILRQSVTDLEANVTYSIDLTIEKTVERSRLKDGQVPLSVRTNSNGQKTFIVEATEDELLNKQAALVSKALRQNALRLMPSDILEECLDQVYATQRTEDAKDPDAARKRLVDAFVSIGVKPSDLKLYLGHEIASSSQHEIAELRAVFAAIRDGEGSWKEALELKQKGANGDAKPATAKDRVAAAREKANGKANGAAQTGTYDPAESGPREAVHDEREPGVD
jgi:hypothetical protein